MKKLPYIWNLTLLLTIIQVSSASASFFLKKIKINGYYKNIIASSKTTDTKERFFYNLNRLRLKLNSSISHSWQINLTIDNEAIINDFANTSDFSIIRSRMQDKLSSVDIDKVSRDDSHLYIRHSLSRAYLKYYSKGLQVTIGKQAIDWGKMRFYSPLDIFNPIGAIDIEHDEKIGVDALNVNFSTGAFSGINIIAAPGRNDSENSFGVKLYHNLGTYDSCFIIANVKKDIIIGLSLDGYLKNAGLRAEITYTHTDSKRTYIRTALGLDYTFNEKLYILLEHFYNGGNDDNNLDAFLTSYKYSSKTMSIKKNISGIWINYKFTPLLETNTFILYNWDGKSSAINPEITYNINSNLDISVGTQLYLGASNSEFGGYENIYYARLKWFF